MCDVVLRLPRFLPSGLAEPGCGGVTFYAGYCYMKHGASQLVPSAGRSSAFVNNSAAVGA